MHSYQLCVHITTSATPQSVEPQKDEAKDDGASVPIGDDAHRHARNQSREQQKWDEPLSQKGQLLLDCFWLHSGCGSDTPDWRLDGKSGLAPAASNWRHSMSSMS